MLDETSASKLKEIKELVDNCYRLKAEADEAEKKYKDAKNKLTEIMENAEVDKMTGEDCTASLALKTSVGVPKEDNKKHELFEYIKKNHGEDVLFRMLTINARTFSSWYTKELEAKIVEGDIDFKLDMLAPYEYFSLGFRKRSKK